MAAEEKDLQESVDFYKKARENPTNLGGKTHVTATRPAARLCGVSLFTGPFQNEDISLRTGGAGPSCCLFRKPHAAPLCALNPGSGGGAERPPRRDRSRQGRAGQMPSWPRPLAGQLQHLCPVEGPRCHPEPVPRPPPVPVAFGAVSFFPGDGCAPGNGTWRFYTSLYVGPQERVRKYV